MMLLRPVPLLVKVFAGAALMAGVLLLACSGPEGVTPDCTYNVGGNGVYADPKGCEQFAKCNKSDPRDCCLETDGGRLSGECVSDDVCASDVKCVDVSPGEFKVCVGSALAMCLHGFGVLADLPIVGGGTGGTGTGSGSTSSTGTGGAGTGGKGTGGAGTGGS